VLALIGSSAVPSGSLRAAAYDPLAVAPPAASSIVDFTVTDSGRRREIPLRVYLPAEAKPAPVVLFSHGLGGNREGSEFLGRHWAARGYAAVFLQHPGSDDGVWRDTPKAQRPAAMQQAASVQNLLLRARDVAVVIDQLAKWQSLDGHALAGRLDLARLGMSGHSFGAVTTQAVSGQADPSGSQRLTDPRIKAALAFSPGPPARGEPARAFGSVRIPWMLMTGTKDASLIGSQTPQSRLNVYPHLPDIAKYELVLDHAEHSAFTDRPLPGDTEPRNPNHHRAILALSTAFWDAHLRDDPAARAWLHGDGAREVLEKDDRWQFAVPGGPSRRAP